MAISTSQNNNVVVKTKLRTVRDLVIGQCLTKTASTALTSTSNASTMDCSLGDHFTYTPTESATITATNVQPNQLVTILFLVSGTANYTVTFGTGMHSTGTLAMGATSARYFVVQFKGNAAGSALFESSRTTAMV